MSISRPLQLYKHLLRSVQKLPPEAQAYYKHYVKQGFNSHEDESDPERVKQIIDKAVEDASWVVQKYADKKWWKWQMDQARHKN